MAPRDYEQKPPDFRTTAPRTLYGGNGGGRRRSLVLVAVIAAAIAASLVVFIGGDLAKADEVRFQNAGEPGPGAFTAPVDVRSGDGVSDSAPDADRATSSPVGDGETGTAGSGAVVGQSSDSGTFGGSGSDRVCDREKLIRELAAKPDRLRAWAGVLDVDPTEEAVAAYIRQLRPVKLTQDTQVTNHAYSNGSAQPFQAVLERGTAVLVDKDGKLVARCACGNPLLEPVELAEETKCYGCTPNYQPPPPCEYYDYEDSTYRRYDDEDFAREYRPSEYEGTCYRPALEPPPVQEPTAPVCPEYPGDDASGEDMAVGEPSAPSGDDTGADDADSEDPAPSSTDETETEDGGVEDPSSDELADYDTAVEDAEIEDPSAPTSDETDVEEDPSAPTSDDTPVEDTEVDDPAPSTTDETDVEEDSSAPASDETVEEDAKSSACEALPTTEESQTTEESAAEGPQSDASTSELPGPGASGLTGPLMTTGLPSAQIGSSLNEVEQRTGAVLDRGPFCASRVGAGGDLFFNYEGDTITTVVVSGDSEITTKSGIGIGDPLDKVFTTYGNAERITGAEESGQGPDALYRDESGNGVVFWADPDGTINLMAAGNADLLAQSVEFCA